MQTHTMHVSMGVDTCRRLQQGQGCATACVAVFAVCFGERRRLHTKVTRRPGQCDCCCCWRCFERLLTRTGMAKSPGQWHQVAQCTAGTPPTPAGQQEHAAWWVSQQNCHTAVVVPDNYTGHGGCMVLQAMQQAAFQGMEQPQAAAGLTQLQSCLERCGPEGMDSSLTACMLGWSGGHANVSQARPIMANPS